MTDRTTSVRLQMVIDQWQREDMGGTKKAHEHAENSRTSDKQTTGHAQHK